MNVNIDNEIIAELEQNANQAIKQAQKAVVAAKVWFYKTTGISLVTPNDIHNNIPKDKE